MQTHTEKPGGQIRPRVSVVMPVYNAENYLSYAIDSLLAQTMPDFELICVDDGSSDHSDEILERYAATDERIHVLRQSRGGAGAARNLGFQEVCGTYTIFLDADDLFAPELLEHTTAQAEKTEADITAFQFKRLYQDGRQENRTGVHKEWLPSGVTLFNYQQCPDHILSVINPTPWNKLYRTQFVREKKLRFEEISSSNDITFAAVSVAMAEKVTYLDEYLVTYRVGHSDTITSTKSNKLDNVKKAVVSAVDQVQLLPYYKMIVNSVWLFVIENIRFIFDHHITDLTDENTAEFYRFFHCYFNSPIFPESGTPICDDIYLNNLYTAIRRLEPEQYQKRLREPVTVSLTSYPARIEYVARALDALWRQTRLPDRVVLWLAEEQFPGGEEELPDELSALIRSGRLNVRWCDDLMPHKKYFYMLQECEEGVVITIDDDLIYPDDMIRRLMTAHLAYPEAIAAMRTHVMAIEQDGSILPYRYWLKETTAGINTPSFQLLATGGAGALYPANIFAPETFDRQASLETCLLADDLWMKAMEIICGVPVVPAADNMSLCYVPDSQKEALWHHNLEECGNDSQLDRIVRWVDKRYGEGFFSDRIRQPLYGKTLLGMEYYAACSARMEDQYREQLDRSYQQQESLRREKAALEKRIQREREERQRITHSRSYRLGRVLTFPVRKIKEWLHRK